MRSTLGAAGLKVRHAVNCRLPGDRLGSSSAAESSRRFVPDSNRVTESDVTEMQRFVDCYEQVFVLTGAGLSTESGIPDYRSQGVGLYARSKHRPVQYKDFLKLADVRQRYWARNYVGWPAFSSVLPSVGHLTLSRWEKCGKINWLVTQNVDALHTKAGHRNMTELHGCSHRVECLGCGATYTRDYIQDYIRLQNPEWNTETVEMAPDGDMPLNYDDFRHFKVPSCEKCSGILKPQVTFFGDNVRRQTVEFLYEKVRESQAVIIAGSSLQVYSGYRFVRKAYDQHKHIAIVNIGPTRADSLATVKIDVKCGDIFPLIEVNYSGD